LTAPAPGHTLATIGQVPAGSGWPRPHPGPAWPRQGHVRPHRGSPDLATKKMELQSPGLASQKMELRGFEPTTLLFEDR
jgi:hypothetical protein